jgi:hypothetical protein
MIPKPYFTRVPSATVKKRQMGRYCPSKARTTHRCLTAPEVFGTSSAAQSVTESLVASDTVGGELLFAQRNVLIASRSGEADRNWLLRLYGPREALQRKPRQSSTSVSPIRTPTEASSMTLSMSNGAGSSLPATTPAAIVQHEFGEMSSVTWSAIENCGLPPRSRHSASRGQNGPCRRSARQRLECHA